MVAQKAFSAQWVVDTPPAHIQDDGEAMTEWVNRARIELELARKTSREMSSRALHAWNRSEAGKYVRLSAKRVRAIHGALVMVQGAAFVQHACSTATFLDLANWLCEPRATNVLDLDRQTKYGEEKERALE